MTLDDFDNYADTAALSEVWSGKIVLELAAVQSSPNALALTTGTLGMNVTRNTQMTFARPLPFSEGKLSLAYYLDDRGTDPLPSEVIIEVVVHDGSYQCTVLEVSGEWIDRWTPIRQSIGTHCGFVDLENVTGLELAVRNSTTTPGKIKIYVDDIVLSGITLSEPETDETIDDRSPR